MDKEEKAKLAAAQKAKNKAADKAKEIELAPRAEKPDVKPAGYVPRMRDHYAKQVVVEMAKRHGLKNPFQVPKLKAIVVNIGVSEARENIQALDQAKEDLALITGQQPSVRRATKSISNFKLREGMPIGVKVTLRGDRMYEFFDRLVSVAIPRIRDFRGLNPGAFDGRGNFNLGLKEQHIFPEVSMEKSPKARGMNISFVTSAGKDETARELLGLLGMPFRNAEKGRKGA